MCIHPNLKEGVGIWLTLNTTNLQSHKWYQLWSNYQGKAFHLGQNSNQPVLQLPRCQSCHSPPHVYKLNVTRWSLKSKHWAKTKNMHRITKLRKIQLVINYSFFFALLVGVGYQIFQATLLMKIWQYEIYISTCSPVPGTHPKNKNGLYLISEWGRKKFWQREVNIVLDNWLIGSTTKGPYKRIFLGPKYPGP